MATLFQLGALLLFLGAVQCKEQIFNDRVLGIKTYEHDLQRLNETGPICQVCKRVLKLVFNKLGKETSKDKISQDLERVCNKLLKILRSTCKKYVEKYKEKLIDIILSRDKVPQACVKLKLCRNPKVSMFFP